MSPARRVAVMPATTAAIGPAVQAFDERFPEAELWHLMDDRLAGDADAAGEIVPPRRDPSQVRRHPHGCRRPKRASAHGSSGQPRA